MTQFNTPAYDIERPTGTCAVTGRHLEPGEHYMAMLIEVDAPDGSTGKATASGGFGLKRLDVSMHAWEQGHRPQELFCFWRSTVPEPGRKKRLFVDDAVLMNLLDRLADTDKPQRLAFRFVLALILMRKKLLRYDRTEHRPGPGHHRVAGALGIDQAAGVDLGGHGLRLFHDPAHELLGLELVRILEPPLEVERRDQAVAEDGQPVLHGLCQVGLGDANAHGAHDHAPADHAEHDQHDQQVDGADGPGQVQRVVQGEGAHGDQGHRGGQETGAPQRPRATHAPA